MQTARNLIEEAESELATASPGRRLEILRRVTDLCVLSTPSLNDDHMDAFDQVITWMAHDMEFRARLELSHRLSTLERAPQKILTELAEDNNFEVAQPILENSRAIAEEVLVRIAERGDEERLISIANRNTVSERLTDIIVQNGGTLSVRTAAQNKGARFSEFGFTQLTVRAEKDTGLHTVLAKRADLPPEVVTRLAEQAKIRATNALKQDLGDPDGDLHSVVGSIAEELVRNPSAAFDDDNEKAKIEVAELARVGKLDEAVIAEWLFAGKVNHALTGIGEMTRLSFSVVKQAFHAAATDTLLFIIKAIPLSLETYHLLLMAKIGHAPSDTHLAAETKNYNILSVATAQRITRFMAVRGAALNAA